MIVSVKMTEKMFCPMGAGSQDVVVCCGPRCMAWRWAGLGEGYCAMCPIEPTGDDRPRQETSEDF